MNSESFLYFLTPWYAVAALLFCAGFAAHRALRRAPAALRELMWRSLFVALLLFPATRLLRPLGMLKENGASAEPSTVLPVETPMPSPLLQAERGRKAGNQPTGMEWQRILAGIWLAGALLVLGRQAGGLYWRQRWLHGARPFADVASVARDKIASDLSGPVRVVISTHCHVPVTWGRTVVLPEDAGKWNAGDLGAVLRHEFAHIARHDHFFSRLGGLLAAILWALPLVWIARRLWRREQEQSCDDAVLRSGTDSASYAALLCRVARLWRMRSAGLAMAEPALLESRVQAVLDTTRPRTAPGGRASLLAAGAVLLTFCAAALAQAPATPSAPKKDVAKPAAQVRAEGLKLDRFQFENANIDEVLSYLRWKSIKLDTATGDLGKRGVNFLLTDKAKSRPVTMELRDTTIWTATVLAATAAGYEVTATDTLLVIHAQGTAYNPVAPDARLANSASWQKALSIVIDRVQFSEARLDEVCAYMTRKSKEADAKKTGVKISAEGEFRMFTFELRNIRLSDMLENLAELSGAEITAEAGGLVFKERAASRKTTPTPSPTKKDAAKPAAQLRAESIKLDRLQFEDASIEEVLSYLRKKSIESDTATGAPGQKGVNFQLTNKEKARPVTMALQNTTIWDATVIAAKAAGFEVTATDTLLLIHAQGTAPKPVAPDASKPVTPDPGLANSASWKKAQSIVIDRVRFNESPLSDACAFLTAKSKEADAKKTGVKISAEGEFRTLTCDLRNIRLSDLLELLAGMSGAEVRAEADGLVFKAGAPRGRPR